MRCRSFTRPLPQWRRFGAVAALVALIFASMAVLPHALAAPAWPPAEAAQAHDHSGDHETAHRHGQAGRPDASGAGNGAGPCESGCITCKDCALCSFATAALPALLPAGADFEGYAPAQIPQPGDIDPARLTKPPRT